MKIRPAGKKQCRTEIGADSSSSFQEITIDSWDKYIEFYENVSFGLTTVSSSAIVD